MHNTSFEKFGYLYKVKLEKRLNEMVSQLNAPDSLRASMNYSLEAGGKRIRPLLLFAVLQAFGKDPDQGMDVAAAIEMIHTYSLIHDDLPSMDDDDLRRGKPTNHIVFGEATAILSGDALLTLSFQKIAEIPDEDVSPVAKLALIKGLAKAAGPEGMVGGQSADMEGESKNLSIAELENIHINKTGKLLEYSILAGAEIANATESEKKLLSEFSHHIGLAFQIRDDILDLEGDEEQIGKPVGSDTANNKSTYPSLLTLDGAKQALDTHLKKAKRILDSLGLDVSILVQITDLIGFRNH